jgi:hypothetical protein
METHFKRKNRNSLIERMKLVVSDSGMLVTVHEHVGEEANKSEEKLFFA